MSKYEIGDIIRESTTILSYKGQTEYHYLILDKKPNATGDNISDIYVVLCLDNSRTGDRIFKDTIYHTFNKVA